MPDASVASEPLSLAAGFPEHTREDWQALVAAVLNKNRPADARLDGPAAEQALRRRLEGGLEVDALYLRDDRALGVPGAMPFTRGRAVRDATLPCHGGGRCGRSVGDGGYRPGRSSRHGPARHEARLRSGWRVRDRRTN